MEILSKIYLSLFECVLWNGIAERTSEYCKKGDLVSIKGRLQSQVKEIENGPKMTLLQLIAEKISFLTSVKPKEVEN